MYVCIYLSSDIGPSRSHTGLMRRARGGGLLAAAAARRARNASYFAFPSFYYQLPYQSIKQSSSRS
jgi:hypothetical protein